MKITIIVTLTLILSACSQYRWVKPGGSDLDLSKELTSCQAKALVDLPPDNVIYNSQTFGYEEKKQKQKEKEKMKKNKYYNERVVNNFSDVNSQQRNVLIRDCMFSKGWNEIVISN